MALPKITNFLPTLNSCAATARETLGSLKNHKVEIATGVLVGTVAAVGIAAAIFFTGGTALAIGLGAVGGGLALGGGAGCLIGGVLAKAKQIKASEALSRQMEQMNNEIPDIQEQHQRVLAKEAQDKATADAAAAQANTAAQAAARASRAKFWKTTAKVVGFGALAAVMIPILGVASLQLYYRV